MASNDDQPSAGQEPDSPQWQQHEYVERFKPDPSQPTALVRSSAYPVTVTGPVTNGCT